MGDNFDPCQCVCSTEWAMRRLLSILRQSQQHCTENECFPEAPALQQPPSDNWDQTMLMMIMWAMFAILLFTTRPNSLRGRQAEKSDRNDDDQHDPPPPDVPPVQ